MIIKGKPRGELEDKRLYLPGVVIIDSCPKCIKTVKQDMKEHYLSYPVMNKRFWHGMYCEDCGHEWKVAIVLTVSLSQ